MENNQQSAHVIVTRKKMERNIRCVLAYLQTRMNRVERFAWESGKHIPDHLLENLSDNELRYFQNYVENLDSYNKSISSMLGADSGNIDLTVDLNPPKELFIEVRVNKDVGTITLPESGEINLQKNTTIKLRRNEAEALIKRGIMSEVV